MIPCLGDDAGRLDQDAVKSKRWIEFDQKFRLDAEEFRAIAVALLDAAFSVTADATHIPFAGSAGRTGDRIGAAHNADDEFAALETAVHWSFFDRAQ